MRPKIRTTDPVERDYTYLAVGGLSFMRQLLTMETEERFKLGRHEPGHGVVEHRYPNTFDFNFGGMVFAPAEGQVEWLLRLANTLGGPFSLTYILLAPLDGFPEGAYKWPGRLDSHELEGWLRLHADLLERDARQDVIIESIPSRVTLKFGEHNTILASTRSLEPVALEHGLSRGAAAMPIPHTHHRHEAFDAQVRELLDERDWEYAPLDS